MVAHVFPFPPPPAERCHALAQTAEAIADRLADQHAPVLLAAAQLLELDDSGFRVRLDMMRDAEGGTLLVDLLAALQQTAADIDLAARTLFVVRARLTAGLAYLGVSHV